MFRELVSHTLIRIISVADPIDESLAMVKWPSELGTLKLLG